MEDPQPVGVIVDTNSARGRLDLIVYDDGILAAKGTYFGVMLRAAGPGMGGAGGGGLGGAVAAGAGSAAGWSAGSSYESKRIATLLEHPRAEIPALDTKNFFIPRDAITGIILRKRWYTRSLTVSTETDAGILKFTWKPALNDFNDVRRTVTTAFGDLVAFE